MIGLKTGSVGMDSQEQANTRAIQVDGLSFAYPGKPPIFRDFSWSVLRGECWAVIGPSGCGKTTLLLLLAGLLRPSGGTVAIGGEAVLRPRMGTGLVLQDYGLLPWATAAENVALGLKLRHIDGSERREAAESWLKRLGLDEVKQHYPAQLSGGQRQRVAIARTLALKPDTLLLDEPFASLDAPTREGLQGLVLRPGQEQTLTTILVTHSVEEAVFVGRHILVLTRPPNLAAHVIDNEGAGEAGFRLTPAFSKRCQDLRAALEPVN